MALPAAKSRRRSEPLTSINIDMDQTRCAHLSSGVAGGWDLTEEEYGIKLGEERRRDRITGREASVKVLGWGGSEVGVPGRFHGSALALSTYTHLQEDEVCMQERMREKDDQSVRLQDVPPGMGTVTGMGMGMGRQRTQSAGESVCLNLCPHLQPHQWQDLRSGFKSVYPGVGM